MIISIAWRNIWRNKMRSIIIMLSVAIGLFAGISVLALYEGMLRSRVKTVIETEVGHLQIHDSLFKDDLEPLYVIKNGEEIMRILQAFPQVKAVSSRSITPGMLSTTAGSAGVQINGILPKQEAIVSQLDKKIVEGHGLDTSKRNEILIGKKLAEKVKLKLGSKTVLTFTDSASNLVAGAFRITGIYQSQNTPLDERNVYITRQALNELLSIGSNFHEIAILLKENGEVNSMKFQLQNRFPGYMIESWKDISPETDLMVNTVDVYSYIILVIIMLALAFGIINTMLMSILERTKETGMMTALGMSRIRMFLLVLWETVLLTITGTPIGLTAAWLLTSYFKRTGLDLSAMGQDMLSSFGYSTTIYPEFPYDKIGALMIIVTGTAILSCLFPAIKAIRMQPSEALRR